MLCLCNAGHSIYTLNVIALCTVYLMVESKGMGILRLRWSKWWLFNDLAGFLLDGNLLVRW